MPEASIALCAGLLGAKGYGFLQQHRTLRSALASAKQNVQQQLAGDSQEGLAAAAERGPAGWGPPAAQRHVTVAPVPAGGEQQQQRTPAAVAARPQQVPEVSPLIQRGEQARQPEQPGHHQQCRRVLANCVHALLGMQCPACFKHALLCPAVQAWC